MDLNLPQMDFSKLEFGAPAAERDIAHGLIDYFVRSEAYERISRRERYILLGNRGTGKSAIFQFLADASRKANEVVIELKPDDYSYEMLAATLHAETDGTWSKQGAFAAAWKYLLFILIMKGVTAHKKGFKTGASARIYSFLRDKYRDGADTPVGVLVSYLKRIEGLNIGPWEAGIKTRQLSDLYKLDELTSVVGDLKDVLSKTTVRVFVDELDKGWDDSDSAKAFVAGLFQAVTTLNEISPSLTVYVSLRQELYDSIPALYDDAQKYRDVMEFIGWDEPSLKTLIAARIKHSIAALKNSDASEDLIWGLVFSENIQYRNAKSFNYIIDRTLYRPRELIQFCTQIVDQNTRTGPFPIDYSIISPAELSYSGERAKDIASEYKFQYPGLMTIFETFRGMQYTFDRSDLELHCLKLAVGDIKVGADATAWVCNQDGTYLIEVLWRVGFLRAQAVGGIKAQRRSGSAYLGPHQVSNLNLHNIARFHVHPMFRSFFGMKEER